MQTSDMQLEDAGRSEDGSDATESKHAPTPVEATSAASASRWADQIIAPDMVTLLDLDEGAIESIVQRVPGGPNNVQEIYALAPVQDGVLFHHILNESAGTYVLSTLFELQSQSQLRALINALQSVIDRHDVLRTAVLWEKLPKPVQVVYRRAELPVEEVALDIGRDPIQQLMERTRQGFDIRKAPLMRLKTMLSASGDRCYAVLQRHHIVFDHQSWNLVFAEVLACLQHRERDLSVPRPYREYVEWSLRHTASQDVEAYFSKRLADWEEPTAPFELLDVHEGGVDVDEARQDLAPELARRVRRIAQRMKTSPARLIHAAWALVVAGTTGRDDIVFGTVLSASRHRIEQARGRPGLFVNTLPLRVSLHNATAKELVEQVHRELAALSQHQQASLTRIQQCSGAGKSPLFTAVLNYRHSAGHSVLDLKPEEAHSVGLSILAQRYRTNYPINLVVDDLGEGFTLTAQTHRSIDAIRILRYAQSAICSLAEALEQESKAQAHDLSILPSDELHQIIKVFNTTKTTYPKHKLIHELFEEQVRCTPEALAVLHEGHSLTYAELNARASRLARFLQKNDVGPDRLVAICVERGVEMVVGLLAILKAGGAYVSLDPKYPIERLQYMLKDSAPRLVLTEHKLMGLLPATGAPVLELNVALNDDRPPSPNIAASELGLSSENLLYVIYTSGSTGRPKGTAMSHRSMVNLIEWHRANLPLREGARVLQFAPLSFDVAFQEIFSTLCNGGTLVLLDEWVRRDPRALVELLDNQRVERLFVPPLMLQSLAECFKNTGISARSLRDVVTAGEQLRISPEIAHFFRTHDACRLHNHYGPTETHVVTTLTLSGAPENWPVLPSIGKPIANTQIRVLDRRRQPVPIGVPGEIYIAGANVARGYLNRPELTAERFISDPFDADPQGHMYRTGDLGKWQLDGSIQYLGRTDDQVKIRGYRIELGEIEAQLTSHADIREAAVIARADVRGEKRLVAYVTHTDGKPPSVDELRNHLKHVLPEYMVPAVFVFLERLPLTPSGKLNRRALPAPDPECYASRRYEAPQGKVEQAIAEIWKELLHVERVGRDDDFFALGGHSLLAMRVIARVQAALSIEMPIKELFDDPTLKEFSAHVEERRRSWWLGRVAKGDREFEELLQRVASMPESQVRQMLSDAEDAP